MGNFRVGGIGVATVHSIFEVQSTLASKVGSHAYQYPKSKSMKYRVQGWNTYQIWYSINA